MRTIWKWALPIEPGGKWSINMPGGAKVVAFQLHDGVPTVSAEVMPDVEPERREFIVVGTGHDIPGGAEHVGTWQEGVFVWHLYQCRFRSQFKPLPTVVKTSGNVQDVFSDPICRRYGLEIWD